MKTFLSSVFILLFAAFSWGATLDNFSDGDYTSDPTWTEVAVVNSAWSVASEVERCNESETGGSI